MKGPLWELAKGSSIEENFELMLDFLLRRGENLNEICGAGETMLHALIIREYFSAKRLVINFSESLCTVACSLVHEAALKDQFFDI